MLLKKSKILKTSILEEQKFRLQVNFQTSCSNLKIRGLGAKLCVTFLLFLFFARNYDVLRSKSPCISLNKNIKFHKNGTKSKMENCTYSLERLTMCFISYSNYELTVKLWWFGVFQKKKECMLCNAFFVQGKFFEQLGFEWNFRIYILLHIKKYYFIHVCGLSLQSSKAFNVSFILVKPRLSFLLHLINNVTVNLENQTKWKKGSIKQIQSNIWEFKLPNLWHGNYRLIMWLLS